MISPFGVNMLSFFGKTVHSGFEKYMQGRAKEEQIKKAKKQAETEQSIQKWGLQNEYSSLYSQVYNSFLDLGEALLPEGKEESLKQRAIEDIRSKHDVMLSGMQPLSDYDKALARMSWNPFDKDWSGGSWNEYFSEVVVPDFMPIMMSSFKHIRKLQSSANKQFTRNNKGGI